MVYEMLSLVPEHEKNANSSELVERLEIMAV